MSNILIYAEFPTESGMGEAARLNSADSVNVNDRYANKNTENTLLLHIPCYFMFSMLAQISVVIIIAVIDEPFFQAVNLLALDSPRAFSLYWAS